jgi:hypothetical protein
MPETVKINIGGVSVPPRPDFAALLREGKMDSIPELVVVADTEFSEIVAYCEYLESVIAAAVQDLHGLQADFLGVTDNAEDPDRLHTWDFLEEQCERLRWKTAAICVLL